MSSVQPAQPSHADPRPIFSPRIDGRLLRRLADRVTATGDEWSTIDAPARGEPLGQVKCCTANDVATAGKIARSAQSAWSRTTARHRARILLRFHDLILDRQGEILDLIQIESGKSRRHAFEEIAEVALVARYYAHTAGSLLRPTRRRGLFPGLTTAVEHRHPLGLVGVIAPWNYPLTLSISDALPALAAGCSVIVKPDERTPFSTLWAAELLVEVGLPPEVLQVVTGPGAPLGEAVVDICDYLVFTGSSRTGRLVGARAAARLIDFTLELGGKNALLVLDDADPGWAANGAVRAGFSNAGQLCVSAERIYVTDALFELFVSELVRRTASLTLSPELDWVTDIGSLISADHLVQVVADVEDAIDKGASILTGGRSRPDIGPCFFEPTVLTGVTPEMRCHSHETFGPVLAVYRVANEEEAIAAANDSEFGLSFSVWTGDRAHGHRVATRLQAGTVTVNDGYGAGWGSIDAPMGGMKASGVGRRHGAAGLLRYTEPQTIAVQRFVPLAPSRLLPPDRYHHAFTAALRTLRRLPGVR